MAAKTFTSRSVALLKAQGPFSMLTLTPRPAPSTLTRLTLSPIPPRAFSHLPQLRTSVTQNLNARAEAIHPRDTPPPEVRDFANPNQDSLRHASYLGESDSNDGHDAVREAYGAAAPSLDAKNSSYLGEADADDGFEVRRDLEGRRQDPVDAEASAFLGEADRDDGFEGRRVVYPEEGDHRIEDTSGSGIHGQSGEGDTFIDEGRK